MTVKLPAVPAMVIEGKPPTIIVLAAAGLTRMLDSPTIPSTCGSVAVIDWEPAVLSVAVFVGVSLVLALVQWPRAK